MHRYSSSSSFYLVGIPRFQPSSLPAAKRLLFADTNHHSCLRKENEGGKKKRGSHGKTCPTRSLTDGQPPSFLLLVELNGQKAVIRTCLQQRISRQPCLRLSPVQPSLCTSTCYCHVQRADVHLTAAEPGYPSSELLTAVIFTQNLPAFFHAAFLLASRKMLPNVLLMI